jgi:hypothetical protein
MRQILAAYGDADPASLTFARGPQSQTAFDCAHEWSVLAVQQGRAIGVDAEKRARSATDHEHCAKLFHAN